MKTKKKSAYSVLVGAINLIKRYGWTKGRLGSVDDGFCIVGAITEASYRGVSDYEAGNVALRYVEALPAVGNLVYAAVYNDSEWTTKKDVLAALKQAAKNAKRRHIRGD